ncbi:hypothetical protein [Burkholderia vietnamiensis]|uniref:hypothetical protein n=2 Tax=Burkholderia vietnamiensis TaxID=60552 RepID=UPI001591EE2D
MRVDTRRPSTSAYRFLHRSAVFLHGVYARASKLDRVQSPEMPPARAMTLILPVSTSDGVSARSPSPACRSAVAFTSPRARVQLPVTLSAHAARLAALLHSPLGMYVVGATAGRDAIRVQLEIAPEDLDFTLHMLMAQQTDAIIGPLVRPVDRVGPPDRTEQA